MFSAKGAYSSKPGAAPQEKNRFPKAKRCKRGSIAALPSIAHITLTELKAVRVIREWRD